MRSRRSPVLRACSAARSASTPARSKWHGIHSRSASAHHAIARPRSLPRCSNAVQRLHQLRRETSSVDRAVRVHQHVRRGSGRSGPSTRGRRRRRRSQRRSLCRSPRRRRAPRTCRPRRGRARTASSDDRGVPIGQQVGRVPEQVRGRGRHRRRVRTARRAARRVVRGRGSQRQPSRSRPRAVRARRAASTHARGDSRRSPPAPDAVARASLEPVGEAPVQVRPLRFRHGLVRRVADQQMAEPERVLAGDVGRSGRISSLRTRRSRWPRDVARRSPASSSTTRAALEHLAHRPTPRSITARSSASSRSRRAASSAWIVGGTATSLRSPAAIHVAVRARAARRRPASRASPRRTAGCPRPPRRSGPRASSGGRASPSRFAISASHLVLGSGSSEIVGGVQLAAAPCRPVVEQLRPRQAEQQDRRVAGPVRDVLDQVEERRLGPVDVVEHDDQRPRVARAPRERRTAQNVSSVGAPPRPPRSSCGERAHDARRRLAVGERARRSSLDLARARRSRRGPPPRFTISRDRPERDALAVGEAPAAEHRGSPWTPAEELLDEPRLADARRRRAP